MKSLQTNLLFVLLILLSFNFVSRGQTVTDFDGNVYNTVTIGTQIWLKENLKSLHYSDGTDIPDVAVYNNADSLAQIYGRLYTWNAAMNGSTTPGVQGVCPCEWHLPTNEEWTKLENFLGGAAVAGGKMKDTTSGYWQNPNTDATNSSGFTGLPAGEFDAYYTPHIFQLINQYGVFWTSTSVNTLKAKERYLTYNSAESATYNWYKTLKYSIRCIKNSATDLNENENKLNPEKFYLFQNYPNPFNPTTQINYSIKEAGLVQLKIYDILGKEIATLVNENKEAGNYSIDFNAAELPSGVYIYQLTTSSFTQTRKMILAK